MRFCCCLALLLAASEPMHCDVDGLCEAPACDPETTCGDGQPCFHGSCLTPCDPAGACYGSKAKCRTDEGRTFCSDADGLPIAICSTDSLP